METALIYLIVCATVVLLAFMFRKQLGRWIDAVTECFRKQNLKTFEAGRDGVKAEFTEDASGDWIGLGQQLPPGSKIQIVIGGDTDQAELKRQLDELSSPPPAELPAPRANEDAEGTWKEL
jgi:hypothetical protein